MDNNENKKKNLLDDSNYNKKSIKRVISIVAFFILVVGFFIDIFTEFNVSIEYANIFVWILGVGLFGVVAERFSVKGKG